MELETGKGTLGKKGDDANDLENQMADSKGSTEVTEHENLGSRNQHSTFRMLASPGKGGIELVEENIQLLNSPDTAEERQESGSGEEERDHHKGQLKRNKKLKALVVIEWIAFLSIMVLLICSLTFKQLQNHIIIWDYRLWKWCVLALLICCGRLLTNWFMNGLLFLVERDFLHSHWLMYYVPRLGIIIRVIIWLALVLLARILLFRSKGGTTKILIYITRALAASIVGAALWLLKSLSVLLLTVRIQTRGFSGQLEETLFYQFIIETLSGRPLKDQTKQSESEDIGLLLEGNDEKCVIDERCSKLSTYKGIESELEAENAANEIFNNVAKHGCSYISKKDLHRFLIKEDAKLLLNKFKGAAETGKIRESRFKKWVVKAYNDRKLLSIFMAETKEATDELNRIFTGIVVVVIVILWLILMEILTTKALVFIISQLVLLTFIFGNTVKNTFESIIFLYVMHPFNVGDRCVIDGVEMLVREIRILKTTFMRFDNVIVFYPNSVLATKPIDNLNRSFANMMDSVEFVIDPSTSTETIEALNSRIKDYLNSEPELWTPHHLVVVKEIEEANKIRMVLHVTHTINFQKYKKKSKRRSKLVLQLKQIFEELGISKYHVLPEEHRVSSSQSSTSAAPQPAN